jgi:hypothetical protein
MGEPVSLLTPPSSLVPVGLWCLGAGACAVTPIGGSREYTARPAGGDVPPSLWAAAAPIGGTREHPALVAAFGLPASLLVAALWPSCPKGIHN